MKRPNADRGGWRVADVRSPRLLDHLFASGLDHDQASDEARPVPRSLLEILSGRQSGKAQIAIRPPSLDAQTERSRHGRDAAIVVTLAALAMSKVPQSVDQFAGIAKRTTSHLLTLFRGGVTNMVAMRIVIFVATQGDEAL